MTAGYQATPSKIDEDITNIALAFRAVCAQARNLNSQVNGSGNGTSYLNSIAYPDPTTALQMISYLNELAGVYFGTVQAGGAGGNGAILFNFDTALAETWAGLV